MKTLKFAFALITLTILSCGPTVNTTKTNAVDLSKFKTFAYLPNSNYDDNTNIGLKNKTVEREIIEATNSNMKKLGYTIDRNRPDLLVLISSSKDSADEHAKPVYATYPDYYTSNYLVSPLYANYYYNGYTDFVGFVEYDVNLDAYNTASLIIRLVDAETKTVVWRGSAFDAKFAEEESVAIAKFVDDIFAEFPKE